VKKDFYRFKQTEQDEELVKITKDSKVKVGDRIRFRIGLEYDMFAEQAGTFSNGIATLQSHYAPEFSAHSKGQKIVME